MYGQSLKMRHGKITVRYYHKKGKCYEVIDHESNYKKEKEIKKRYNSKPAKTFWTGKNFNKRRYKV